MAIKKVKSENSAKTQKKENTVQIIPEGLEKKLQENLEDKDKKPVEVVVETTPEKEEEKPKVTVSVQPQPESTPIPEKRVRVLMRENHKCCIGGEWYYLLKGKYYNVPENVKNILMNADKLSPL